MMLEMSEYMMAMDPMAVGSSCSRRSPMSEVVTTRFLIQPDGSGVVVTSFKETMTYTAAATSTIPKKGPYSPPLFLAAPTRVTSRQRLRI